MKYTKHHLVRYFAKEAKVKIDLSEEITRFFLGALLKLLIDMKVGDKLEIRGFGVFYTKFYKGRTNLRNPHTGEGSAMAARRRLTFRPSESIKREYKKL